MKSLRLWIWGSLYSLHLVSLDVLGVTVSWLLLVTLTVTGEFPDPHQVGMIASGVWVAYTCDRLMDGAVLNLSQPHSMRHRVHQQYRNRLMAVICVVVLSMIALMLVMCSMIEVIAGLLLIGLIGVYFYCTQLRRAGRFRFEKGPCVGFLLGLAVSMPSLLGGGDLPRLVSSFSLVVVLFSLNCYVVSFLEMQLDRSQEEIEDTTKRGHDFRVLLSFSVYLMFLGYGWLWQCIPGPLAMATVLSSLCLMTLVLQKQLWLLDSCTGDFTYHTVYSFFADLSLSIPAVVVLVWL